MFWFVLVFVILMQSMNLVIRPIGTYFIFFKDSIEHFSSQTCSQAFKNILLDLAYLRCFAYIVYMTVLIGVVQYFGKVAKETTEG